MSLNKHLTMNSIFKKSLKIFKIDYSLKILIHDKIFLNMLLNMSISRTMVSFKLKITKEDKHFN